MPKSKGPLVSAPRQFARWFSAWATFPLPDLRHYGLSVLCPAAALGVSLLFRGRLDPALVFVIAVSLPSWFGGIWPGLVSAMFSFLAMDYYFLPPLYSFATEVQDLPYVVFFTLVAGVVSWLSDRRTKATVAQMQPTEAAKELTSWKEIADHLGVNVRTAQRWEQEKSLPVKRASGERGRVMAIPEELDSWKTANLTSQSVWSNVHFLRGYGIAASGALLIVSGVALGVWLRSHGGGPPARLRVEDKEIIVADAEGRERWRYAFAEPITPDSPRTASWFGHLEPSKNMDTLFVLHPARLANTKLLCFTERGKLRWEFSAGKPVSDGRVQYPAVYFINSFKVLPASKESAQKIVLSANHGWSYPDQVAVLEPTGKLAGEYWHSGHLSAMEIAPLSSAGSLTVALAGVDNGRRQATVVFLDPNNVHGASMEDDDAYNLRGFGAGTETSIVWFERSCVNEASQNFNYATEVTSVPGGLQVVVMESPENGAYVIYVLDKDLNVTYVEVSSGFKALHRRLEEAGRLKHHFSDEEVNKLAHVQVVRRR
jgi:hypothetical protein